MGPILGIPEKGRARGLERTLASAGKLHAHPLVYELPQVQHGLFLAAHGGSGARYCGQERRSPPGDFAKIRSDMFWPVANLSAISAPNVFFRWKRRSTRRGRRRRRPNAEAVTAPEPSKAEMGFVQVTASAQWRGTRADPVRAEVTRTDVSWLGLYGE